MAMLQRPTNVDFVPQGMKSDVTPTGEDYSLMYTKVKFWSTLYTGVAAIGLCWP